MKLTWIPPAIPQEIIAQYSYSADHAVTVHEGEVTAGGQIVWARPWTDVAIGRNDLPQLVAGNVRQGMSIPDAFINTAEYMATEFQDVIDNHDWGFEGRGEKIYQAGSPTWRTITDSGDLRNSQSMEIYVHQ
jgi:hypothetical protein